MISEPSSDIPVDYRFVNWEGLHTYVGRAVIGDGIPYMNEKVAKYLEEQARQLHRAADRLAQAAKAIKKAES